MARIIIYILLFTLPITKTFGSYILLPMDDVQRNHLKAYGITYWSLEKDVEVKWLLNYRGGSFLMKYEQNLENECVFRGVSYEIVADAQASNILLEIGRDEINMDAVVMQRVPRIAVYSPPNKQPWDDAVTLVLTYAEIPYDLIYDQDVVDGVLTEYDWLHLHHEDFTGQYGKFYKNYQHMPWYREEVKTNENIAQINGFLKVSELKLYVAQKIRSYIENGGFLFAMCAATDTYDIALSAEHVDICESMYDGDPADKNIESKLDFNNTLAFENFIIEKNPFEYEFSDIDATTSRRISPETDFFTLFEFSAKWDPVPTMLTQNHSQIIKGFMGQTTSFNKEKLKPEVLILGENKSANEARYIHGELGKGFFTFYGGHDPEDYRHLVGDPPTNLNLYPTSPGYRLILNNILFPAAKKKKRKT
jgi:hypothetical protein